MGSTNHQGEVAFFDGNNMTQLNPVFFQQYARQVAAVGRLGGMGVLIVGVMGPVAWHGNYPTKRAACRFAEQFAARLAGMSHVMFSPSFDATFQPVRSCRVYTQVCARLCTCARVCARVRVFVCACMGNTYFVGLCVGCTGVCVVGRTLVRKKVPK